MIEMTWGQIREPDFSSALNKLIRQEVDYSTALKLLTLVKGLEVEQQKAADMYKIMFEKHFKKESDSETAEYKVIDQVEADKEFKKFSETKCKFRIPKVKPNELGKTKLSAIEALRIEPIMEVETDKDDSYIKAVTEANETRQIGPEAFLDA